MIGDGRRAQTEADRLRALYDRSPARHFYCHPMVKEGLARKGDEEIALADLHRVAGPSADLWEWALRLAYAKELENAFQQPETIGCILEQRWSRKQRALDLLGSKREEEMEARRGSNV